MLQHTPGGRLPVFVALLLSTALALLVPNTALTDRPVPDEFEAACAAGDPYFVAASYRGVTMTHIPRAYDLRAPSVLLFTDSPANRPHYSVASYKETGAVWGLAYSKVEQAVYAAAYHKVQLPFGPGGPGAIYRIDLDSGQIDVAATVPDAGDDEHRLSDGRDTDAEEWAGRTGLGDLDLSGDESELYVTNLATRRIYRFQLPGAKLLGSFGHGASGEPWADEARPFGLAWDNGFVYHGVVHSAERSLQRADLRAYVYRSKPDGSQMTEVASFDLTYRRGRVGPFTWADPMPYNIKPDARYAVDWQPWRDGPQRPLKWQGVFDVYAMPVLADIVFDGEGNMAVGMRDRRSDSLAHFTDDFAFRPNKVGLGVGDILRGVPIGNRWTFDTANEFYKDRVARFGDETAQGGLAAVPGGDRVVMGSYVVQRHAAREGVYWYDAVTGEIRQSEQLGEASMPRTLYSFLEFEPGVLAHDEVWVEEVRAPGTVGDVETLCTLYVPPTPTPTASPTSTPTVTNTPPPPSATPTYRPSPGTTPTATAIPLPLYLPLTLREECQRAWQVVDVVLVVDASTSMLESTPGGRSKLDTAVAAVGLFLDQLNLTAGDQAAIVSFNANASVLQALTGNRDSLNRALGAIETAAKTRIHLGVDAARRELSSDRRRPANSAVMIVLTDGRANPDPVSLAVEQARLAKVAGVTVFTIGLGNELDEAALRQMASTPSGFYHAPTAEELAAIYRAVAVELPCPASVFWGRR